MATQTGSCLCGNIKISITGEYNGTILCHCLDCHKISGSHFSDNIKVNNENITLVSGTPKKFVKTADSGAEIVSHFCGDCGCTLWRSGAFFPGGVVVKTGVLEDQKWVEEMGPVAELFAQRKAGWLPEIAKS